MVGSIDLHWHTVACRVLSSPFRAIWLNLPGMAAIITLSCLVGVVMFAFYAKCDPVSVELVDKADQVKPVPILKTMLKPAQPSADQSCCLNIFIDLELINGCFVEFIEWKQVLEVFKGLTNVPAKATVTAKRCLQNTVKTRNAVSVWNVMTTIDIWCAHYNIYL